MLGNLEVTQTAAQMAAVIRIEIPQMELPTIMGPAIDELMTALGSQGVAPAGPVFNRYLSMEGGMFDFEVGVPVSSPVSSAGRVKPGELPGARVVRATHTGPYADLHRAWREFGELARAQGHEPAGAFWENYVYGPESNPDPSTWRTELNQPVAE